MNEFLTLGQLNEQAIQREKALKAAASCTPKKAIYIPVTESAFKRELGSAPPQYTSGEAKEEGKNKRTFRRRKNHSRNS